MTQKTVTSLATAFVLGCFLLMVGLAMSRDSSSGSNTGLRWLGEGIGDGIAHAACIQVGGEWEVYKKCILGEKQ